MNNLCTLHITHSLEIPNSGFCELGMCIPDCASVRSDLRMLESPFYLQSPITVLVPLKLCIVQWFGHVQHEYALRQIFLEAGYVVTCKSEGGLNY